jgi:hypothetical protein
VPPSFVTCRRVFTSMYSRAGCRAGAGAGRRAAGPVTLVPIPSRPTLRKPTPAGCPPRSHARPRRTMLSERLAPITNWWYPAISVISCAFHDEFQNLLACHTSVLLALPPYAYSLGGQWRAYAYIHSDTSKMRVSAGAGLVMHGISQSLINVNLTRVDHARAPWTSRSHCHSWSRPSCYAPSSLSKRPQLLYQAGDREEPPLQAPERKAGTPQVAG